VRSCFPLIVIPRGNARRAEIRILMNRNMEAGRAPLSPGKVNDSRRTCPFSPPETVQGRVKNERRRFAGRAAEGELARRWDRDQPPAIAARITRGSAPFATASGSGASGDRWDRSCSQAKNRRNGRRSSVTWSRIVPRSAG